MCGLWRRISIRIRAKNIRMWQTLQQNLFLLPGDKIGVKSVIIGLVNGLVFVRFMPAIAWTNTELLSVGTPGIKLWDTSFQIKEDQEMTSTKSLRKLVWMQIWNRNVALHRKSYGRMHFYPRTPPCIQVAKFDQRSHIQMSCKDVTTGQGTTIKDSAPGW